MFKETLDTNQINDLVNHSTPVAKEKALEMLESNLFKANKFKKAKLIKDIHLARSANEVCRIMYYIYLAGTGLSVTGSSWQKHYGEM